MNLDHFKQKLSIRITGVGTAGELHKALLNLADSIANTASLEEQAGASVTWEDQTLVTCIKIEDGEPDSKDL